MATAADMARAFIATQGDRHRSVLTDASGQVAGARAAIDAAGRVMPKAPPKLARRKAGGTAITLDTEAINRWTFELLALERPAVAHAFARRQVPVATHAIEQWPVKTGESRTGLAMLFEYRADEAFAVHLGTAPHTYFVKYAIHAAAKKARDSQFFRAVEGRLKQLSRGGVPTSAIAEQVAREFRTTVAVVLGSTVERQNVDLRTKSYKLPGGADARGAHAWSAQIYRPATDAIPLMADDVVAFWESS